MLLTGTLAASIWSDHRAPAVLAKPIDSIGKQIGGWTSNGDQQLRDTIVASLAASSYVSRIYKKDRNELDFFMAFYAQQRAGDTMHSPKYCLPGGGWEFSDSGMVTVPASRQGTKINRLAIRRAAERALVFYWYQSRERIIASEYQGKFFLVWDGLMHGSQGGSIVRIMLPDRPGADLDGLAFATQIIPEVQRCFGTDYSDLIK
jgi:EpsI family protein